MTYRALLLAASLALFACNQRSLPAPASSTAPTLPPAIESAPAASAPAPGPAESVTSPSAALPGYTILSTAAWPGAGGFDDVVAVLAEKSGERDSRILTWFRKSEMKAIPVEHGYPIGTLEPKTMSALDVTGDGRNELVIFASRGGQISESLEIFELLPQVPQPRQLVRETAALDGATSEAEIRKLLPLSRGLSKNEIADASLTALFGRLSYATASQFRELVDAKGLELCTSVAQNHQNAQRTCRRIAAQKITDALLEQEIRPILLNALEPMIVMTFECRADSCLVGQPSGYEKELEFRSAGARRKLVRITEIDPGIGE